MLTAEQKQRAIRLYKNKDLTIPEISNLTDISVPQLTVLFRQAFEMGLLKPRKAETALKPRTPNGQGKPRRVPTGQGSGGHNRKFTEEQEKEIAVDYYENGFTLSKLKEKWNIHPMQLQRIRAKFGANYEQKSVTKKAVQQFDKGGNLIAEFESGLMASKQTGVSYTNINACCNQRSHSAGGFVWKFKNQHSNK